MVKKIAERPGYEVYKDDLDRACHELAQYDELRHFMTHGFLSLTVDRKGNHEFEFLRYVRGGEGKFNLMRGNSRSCRSCYGRAGWVMAGDGRARQRPLKGIDNNAEHLKDRSNSDQEQAALRPFGLLDKVTDRRLSQELLARRNDHSMRCRQPIYVFWIDHSS